MLRKILSLALNSNPSYIGIYDDVLPSHECERLISLFEKSPHAEGKCYAEGTAKVNHDYKKCIELFDGKFSKGDVITNIFSPYLREGIIKYKKEYPVRDIDTMGSWKCDDVYTFKKYENDDDGFKIWHTEQGPTTPSRILAWQFYLNNAESGTEFMHYPTIRAIMGRLIIWPAAWTHFHRSEPNKGLKYIISGWHYYSNEK